MSESNQSLGGAWLNRLVGVSGAPAFGQPSVIYADAKLGDETARFIAVVPDPHARFPRARTGEVGLEEGWTLARLLRETRTADDDAPSRRPIVAVVDVVGQAYGLREEMLGVHLACAAAADAYAQARLAGHPIVALLVGKAMSGAFLAHGYQANRLIALRSPDVLVHAMGKAAAARITRRPVEALEALGERVPPMAYDIQSYAKLGLLHQLIYRVNAEAPSEADVERVRTAVQDAIDDIRRRGDTDLSSRLTSPEAQHLRAASIEARRRLAEQWDADV
jgi:malonate decarboxylase gamma subunit